MAKVKKSIKKAKDGEQVPNPSYKNLRMGVNAKNSQGLGYVKESKPTSKDSADYRAGYIIGIKGGKASPGEGPVQKMGRWEGQNAKKPAPVNKAKAGASLKPVAPAKKKSLGKLPEAVRHQMGYQKDGGKVKAKSGASMKKCKYGCK